MQILEWLRDGFFSNRTRYRHTDGVRPVKAEREEREDRAAVTILAAALIIPTRTAIMSSVAIRPAAWSARMPDEVEQSRQDRRKRAAGAQAGVFACRVGLI